jgi:hypothetical protein
MLPALEFCPTLILPDLGFCPTLMRHDEDDPTRGV